MTESWLPINILSSCTTSTKLSLCSLFENNNNASSLNYSPSGLLTTEIDRLKCPAASKQFPNIKDWVLIVSDSPNKHARLHSNCHKCLHFNLLVISGQKSVGTRGCYKHTRICIHLLTCPVLTLWVWGFCLRQCQQGSLCAAETGVWQGRKLSSVRECALVPRAR